MFDRTMLGTLSLVFAAFGLVEIFLRHRNGAWALVTAGALFLCALLRPMNEKFAANRSKQRREPEKYHFIP
jgi:hypothetical protein